MKKLSLILFLVFLLVQLGCNSQSGSEHKQVKDGVIVHLSHGIDNPHRVLMALQMASIMSEDHDVLVYFDIKGIEVVLKDAPDIKYSHFPSSHTQLDKLIAKNVTIMACPGCLKAAGKTGDDLREGVQIADKQKFFNFTSGRIITLEY